ncbi:hypothetical protein [Winogradskyella sp. PC-19]|uniref:hypothetical protein n=1 Tax=Winogradskyella sp. PC-19 TaxID=754417 RepID=UPI0012FB7848|nr:hypothetical protein [Winogradskyella sp. PC-19]
MKKSLFIITVISCFFAVSLISTSTVVAQSGGTEYCYSQGHWEHLPIPSRPMVMVCDNSGNSVCVRPCKPIIVSIQ